MEKPIQILLVEDNSEYRDVINLAIGRETDMEMLSQFGTAEKAIASLTEGSASARPDIVLLDLCLPGMSGLDAIPLILDQADGVKIIVLSQSDAQSDVMRAITLGVSGYLLKSSTSQQIKEAIRNVVNGYASIDPSIAKYLLKNLREKPSKSAVKQLLSKRELQVLELLADGDMKKEISDKLHISYSTVDAHVRHIYEKLNVRNAPAAVRTAYQMGIFPSDDWL